MEGPGNSEEGVETVDLSVLVGPPAVEFTDPMDVALNLGHTLQSNSYKGRSSLQANIQTLDAIFRALEFMMDISTDLILSALLVLSLQAHLPAPLEVTTYSNQLINYGIK